MRMFGGGDFISGCEVNFRFSKLNSARNVTVATSLRKPVRGNPPDALRRPGFIRNARTYTLRNVYMAFLQGTWYAVS